MNDETKMKERNEQEETYVSCRIIDGRCRYSVLKKVKHSSPLLTVTEPNDFLPKNTKWKGGEESNFIMDKPDKFYLKSDNQS